MYSSVDTNKLAKLSVQTACGCLCVLSMCISTLTHAAPKIFKVVVNESVQIERLYEVRDISFTILKAITNDTFLENGIVKGQVGLDPISGRMIVEITELSKAGMSMEAVGYIENTDNEKGIAACTLWQTRMFEDSKLCYEAEVLQGQEFKIVLSIDEQAGLPSVAGQ